MDKQIKQHSEERGHGKSKLEERRAGKFALKLICLTAGPKTEIVITKYSWENKQKGKSHFNNNTEIWPKRESWRGGAGKNVPIFCIFFFLVYGKHRPKMLCELILVFWLDGSHFKNINRKNVREFWIFYGIFPCFKIYNKYTYRCLIKSLQLRQIFCFAHKRHWFTFTFCGFVPLTPPPKIHLTPFSLFFVGRCSLFGLFYPQLNRFAEVLFGDRRLRWARVWIGDFIARVLGSIIGP